MKKNRNVILIISVIVNIILAIVFIIAAAEAVRELKFSYMEEGTIIPDSIRSNLERENYGVAASLSHPIRGGAEVDARDRDYYMLGEYADLLFLKEIFKEAQNTQTAQSCEQRLDEIKNMLPECGDTIDRIEWSAQNAGK